jgi:hypothetical protein
MVSEKENRPSQMTQPVSQFAPPNASAIRVYRVGFLGA